MGPQPNSPLRISFGPFEYDGALGELRKNGTRLRLTGQPLQILEVLLEVPGQAVGREEIQQRLWQGTTFVDFEHGLNAAINKLRQILGDSADRPRYIETLPGRGYRFIGAVQRSSRAVLEMVPTDSGNRPSDEAGSVAEAPTSARQSSRFRFGSRASAVLLLTILTVAGLFAVLRISRSGPRASNSTAPTMRFRVAIPDGVKLAGSQTFSLSPDGRTLVYRAQAGKEGELLWAQSLDSLEPRVLPGTKGGGPAFWSPDSKFVVFNSENMLKKVDFSGNPPQVICAVPNGIVLGGSWDRNGTIIFGTEASGVMRVDANTGQAVPMTTQNTARGERVLAWPTLLPDGRHFLYSRLSSVTGGSGVFVGSLDAKPGEQDLKRLVETPFASQFVASTDGNGTVLFLRETTLWAQNFDASRLELTGEPKRVAEHVGSHRAFGFFGSSSTGALVHRSAPMQMGQPTWFDRRGRRLATQGQPFDLEEGFPRISPDGTRLAYAKFEAENVDVWVQDLARDVNQRTTFDPAIDERPIWSSDGKRIAFSSARLGHYDLYQIGAGGEGGEELLYSSNENKYATSWSSDGRYLLYSTENESANQGIWVLAVQGTGKHTPVPLIHHRANEKAGALSPDSHWIAYESSESGKPEVYVQRFTLPPGRSEGTPKVLLSRGGGSTPHWRADGKEIFYRSPEGMLMSVPVTTADAIQPEVPQSLFQLAGSWWDATRDGDRFLVGVPIEQGVPPFTVVLNWQAETKK